MLSITLVDLIIIDNTYKHSTFVNSKPEIYIKREHFRIDYRLHQTLRERLPIRRIRKRFYAQRPMN
jgi:hypothetical protein